MMLYTHYSEKGWFMKVTIGKKVPSSKMLFRKCHLCGHIAESTHEVEKCPSCKKSFLPLNYFQKIESAPHKLSGKEYQELFAKCDELYEDELIKGIYVIW